MRGVTDKDKNIYPPLIERIFETKYKDGDHEVLWERTDITVAASALGIDKPPLNLGDLLYSYRYRVPLPGSVRGKAPTGHEWVIRPRGTAKYAFTATTLASITPREGMSLTKVPDATPAIISRYRLNDEQALLAKLRYNRLIDIFTRVTCYSLQNHLRSSIPGVGQVETDEVYIGVDRKGAHYVFPVQVKRGKDTLSIVQVWQDIELCAYKFRPMQCRPIAAQFMADDVIAMFEFELGTTPRDAKLLTEKHYKLIPYPWDAATESEFRQYLEKEED